MNLRSALITGANRGIGLELVRQLSQKSPPLQLILATCRQPEDAKDLHALTIDNPNIKIIQLDVTKAESIRKVKELVESLVGTSGLDLLVNNAGVIAGSFVTSFDDVTADLLRTGFDVNAIGPIMVTQALVPYLKRGASTSKTFSMVVNVSSDMGSIKANTTGGFFAYRISKTALNMATKNMALALKEDKVMVLSFHPGWVQTDMGGSNAPLTKEECVKGLMNVISSMTMDKTAIFIDYSGKIWPW